MDKYKAVFICIFVLIFSSILALFLYSNKDKIENYVANNQISNINSSTFAFMNEYGFNSVKDIEDFLGNDYNENLENILEDMSLTVYYSDFSKKSTENLQNNIWKNISPYHIDNNKACKISNSEQSCITFSETPYFNRSNGIELLSNKLTGPPSHLLGIQGNGTFSIFMCLNFNGFSKSNSEDYAVFELYGNTKNNNGVSLYINHKVTDFINNTTKAQMYVVFGVQTIVSTEFNLKRNNPYLIILVKKNKKISLNVHDISKDAKQNTFEKLIDQTEIEHPAILLSNKEMEINSNLNLNANIYAFGIYNQNLEDETFLHHYMHIEVKKTTDHFAKEAKQHIQFQHELNDLKKCPYDNDVCNDCSEISDWNRMSNVIHSSSKCKSAIDSFCTKNPTHPECKCWDSSNTNSLECEYYKSIFKQKPILDINNMNKDDINKLKQKYDLCDCNEIKNSQSEMNKLKELLQQKEKPLLKSPYVQNKDKCTTKNKHETINRNPIVDNPSLLSNHPKIYEENASDYESEFTDPYFKNKEKLETKSFWKWLTSS